MKAKKLSEKAFPALGLIVALIMLFNPNINILDVLPDFIGYLLISHLIKDVALRVPFFEEARRGFLKLALLSFIKYPAFLLMVMIRGQNTLDNDVITLFSFAFAVIEIILAVKVINDLFAGISYLGQRTGAKSVIGENPTADNLHTMTTVFTVLKCALYAIPEFLLLTTTADAGSYTSLMSESRFYPLVLIICQIIGYAFGLAWLAFFGRYIIKIKKSNEFYSAVMQLSSDEKEAEIKRKTQKEKILVGLKILPFAALFSFDFRLSQFNGVSILPHFVIGIFLIFFLLKISNAKSKLFYASLSVAAIYTVFSAFVWGFGIYYCDTYSSVDIMLYGDAGAAFTTYAALSSAEAALLIALLVFVTLTICGFIVTNTGKTRVKAEGSNSGEAASAYSSYDKQYHRSMKIKAWIFFSLGVISTAAKLIFIFTNNNRVFADGTLMPSVAPWLGSVIFIISLIWAVYTMYFANILKEDFCIKYCDSESIAELKENQNY